VLGQLVESDRRRSHGGGPRRRAAPRAVSH
jgi:hypothetical protein